ncbi:MAG TPA: hypothetical protein VF773_08190 [Verrucomicrobiae bacterium]
MTSSRLFFEAIARKVEADPTLLSIALGNIERWLAKGHTAEHRLVQWREIIERALERDGLDDLLKLLRSQDEEAVHLKSFDPFPGILSSKERQEILLVCPYAH